MLKSVKIPKRSDRFDSVKKAFEKAGWKVSQWNILPKDSSLFYYPLQEHDMAVIAMSKGNSHVEVFVSGEIDILGNTGISKHGHYAAEDREAYEKDDGEGSFFRYKYHAYCEGKLTPELVSDGLFQNNNWFEIFYDNFNDDSDVYYDINEVISTLKQYTKT